MEHLCKVVVYLTDVRHREAVYRTMGEYIRGVHPVSTGLVVTALARPSGWSRSTRPPSFPTEPMALPADNRPLSASTWLGQTRKHRGIEAFARPQ